MNPLTSPESVALCLLASVGFIVTVFGLVGIIILASLRVQAAWKRRNL